MSRKDEQLEHAHAEISLLREMNLALAGALRRAKVRSIRDGQLRSAVLEAHDEYVAEVRRQHDHVTA